MAGANTNFVTGPGLRHGSLIYTHDKMHQLQDMSGCSDTVSWWNDDNATIGSQPPERQGQHCCLPVPRGAERQRYWAWCWPEGDRRSTTVLQICLHWPLGNRPIWLLLRHFTPSEELYQIEMLSARYVLGRGNPSTFWWCVGTPTAKSMLGPCRGRNVSSLHRLLSIYIVSSLPTLHLFGHQKGGLEGGNF